MITRRNVLIGAAATVASKAAVPWVSAPNIVRAANLISVSAVRGRQFELTELDARAGQFRGLNVRGFFTASAEPLSLTRDQFLEVLRLTGGAFDQLQHAGHVALAFGTPLPATPGWYLDLDLVAMATNLGLTPSLGREISTAIVGGYFHQWASAVGHAEADPNQNFFMAIGLVGWDAAKKRAKLLLVTHGTLDQIAGDFRDTKDLVGVVTVNISDIIRRLRAHAQAAGIDLRRPFFFLPDDPRFHEILTQVRRERDARIARLRRYKKKFAATKRRARRPDIIALPRVKDVNYPLAMQEMA